jgi:hypothetical protein
MHRLLSAATVTVVGLSSKALTHSAFASVAVNGLSTLTAALESPARDQGQGVLTGIFSAAFSSVHAYRPFLSCKPYLHVINLALAVSLLDV